MQDDGELARQRDLGLAHAGTLGDPSLASPEKGARFLDAVVGELVRFIEDFSKWKIPPGRG